jgi:5-methyltetrahydrofolate--homocysteine methyltransferase
MGTVIQNRSVPESSYGVFYGNNEILNLTAPGLITEIHREYYEAGADVVVTNTFGANSVVLSEYGLADKVAEINKAAVQCAKDAAAGLGNRYIALSVGPGSKLPTLSQINYETLYSAYYEQIYAGSEAGADIVIIETSQDLLQIKAALAAANAAAEDLPVMVSFTAEKNGTLLVGSDIACICAVLGNYNIFSLGINCGFGPDGMRIPLAELAERWKGRLYLSPNAGMPILKDGKTFYPLEPEAFADQVAELVRKYRISIAGGCCGTSAAHIKALNNCLDRAAQRFTPAKSGAGLIASAYSAYPLKQTPAPAIVGERANATGSKIFRDMLKAGNLRAMVSAAKKQEGAAHIIDLSLAVSGGNERDDMEKITPLLNAELTAPLMIDSTSYEVIETALKRVSGKPVINSVSLEDGGDKMRKILGLLKFHPAAVVALTIDEEGMALNTEKKLAAARRICGIWIDEYDYSPEDLLIDFLTFAVTSGDESSRYAAVHTLDAIRIFKKEYPAVGTILGISNISFGMPQTARATLNSVFLHKAVQAGLSAAIVHAEKVIPVNSITAEDRVITEKLLNGEDGALDNFIAHFAAAAVKMSEKEEKAQTSEELLTDKVLKGDNSGIAALLDDLLTGYDASKILNSILLPAMEKVGEFFGEGKLLLPFVLKSAEVMKECTDILAPRIKGLHNASRGKIVLATVKGDVHDIGKNLVDIIMSGNGFEVINMGTKISGDEIVRAAIETGADAVGMSGLLVKSVTIMKENIELIKQAGLDIKVLLGGAALSEEYVARECAPVMEGKVYYCKDAFDGIAALTGGEKSGETALTDISADKNPFKNIRWDFPYFEGSVVADFYGYSSVKSVTVAEILPYLRKKSLFEGRWGYRDKNSQSKEAEELLEKTLQLLESASIAPKMTYGFFRTRVQDNRLLINSPSDTSVKSFTADSNMEWKLFSTFPVGENGECFTDLYRTMSGISVLPIQLVTLGANASLFASSFFADDKYVKYYQVHGLLAEITEALAEYAQKEVLSHLTIESGSDRRLPGKLIRYSFGYPICPDLNGNKILCDLLNAGRFNVMTGESCQMEPVYTTCAMLSWRQGV